MRMLDRTHLHSDDMITAEEAEKRRKIQLAPRPAQQQRRIVRQARVTRRATLMGPSHCHGRPPVPTSTQEDDDTRAAALTVAVRRAKTILNQSDDKPTRPVSRRQQRLFGERVAQQLDVGDVFHASIARVAAAPALAVSATLTSLSSGAAPKCSTLPEPHLVNSFLPRSSAAASAAPLLVFYCCYGTPACLRNKETTQDINTGSALSAHCTCL